nr:hypothetical protein GCM10020092_081730 [Actinoplanes digitatis]
MRLLQHPPRAGRVAGLPLHRGELLRGGEHVGIVLAEVGAAQVDGVLERGTRLAEIAGGGERLGVLPGGEER